jgi:hypothetical protein
MNRSGDLEELEVFVLELVSNANRDGRRRAGVRGRHLWVGKVEATGVRFRSVKGSVGPSRLKQCVTFSRSSNQLSSNDGGSRYSAPIVTMNAGTDLPRMVVFAFRLLWTSRNKESGGESVDNRVLLRYRQLSITLRNVMLNSERLKRGGYR